MGGSLADHNHDNPVHPPSHPPSGQIPRAYLDLWNMTSDFQPTTTMHVSDVSDCDLRLISAVELVSKPASEQEILWNRALERIEDLEAGIAELGWCEVKEEEKEEQVTVASVSPAVQ